MKTHLRVFDQELGMTFNWCGMFRPYHTKNTTYSADKVTCLDCLRKIEKLGNPNSMNDVLEGV